MGKAKIKGKTGGEDVADRAFSDGILIYVDIRMWGASARLDSSVLRDLGIKDQEILDQVDAVRSLLTPEGNALLNEYRVVRNEVKGWIYRNSLPFPVDGFVFLPKDLIERTDNYLKQRQEEAQAIVETFVPKIKQLEADYATKFPQLYDQKKYPSEEVLRRHFTFRWSFRVFTPPSEEAKLLPPSVYREEVERFRQDISKMREMTLNAVGNALIERVAALSKQCENDEVKTQTIEAMKNFLEKFDNLFSGFVNEDKLRKLIGEVKEYMDGTDAAMLGADETFRTVVGNKMREVAAEIKTVPGLQLKRAFEL
jgi:hypothetical protein